MLVYAAVLMAAAILAVLLFKRLGLGAVLGYLAAGVVVGPSGLAVVPDAEAVLHFSELGVVLLLFVIGLELQPARLWALRGAVFGVGSAQVLLCGVALAALALLFGLPVPAAVVVGLALALSSTAFVMQLLGERQEMETAHGRRAFAVLLLQDLAVIPMLAAIPLLALRPATAGGFPLDRAALAVGAIFAVILGGRYLLRPLLRLLAATGVSEIFTAAALLLVLATGLLMDAVGLSMSLGAFLAGVLLADSEYRHELQADIEPFKGLLLGLFFMAVGMFADIGQLLSRPLEIAALVLALVLVKLGVMYALGRALKMAHAPALAMATALSQGGEFAFVLFAAAVSAGIIAPEVQQTLILVVTLSMVTTPVLYGLQARLRQPEEAPPFDGIDTQPTPVIIAGFGPSGQIVGRVLRTRRIPFTVLESNWRNVDFVRRLGNPVYFSDATRIEVLRAAHAASARLVVIAIPDLDTSMKIAETVHRHFPGVKIMAFARDRRHALALMDAGVALVVRRTFLSSLSLAHSVLVELGLSETQADQTVERFQQHDEQTLLRQLAVFSDEEKLIQDARQAARELEQLFESDRDDAVGASLPEAAPKNAA